MREAPAFAAAIAEGALKHAISSMLDGGIGAVRRKKVQGGAAFASQPLVSSSNPATSTAKGAARSVVQRLQCSCNFALLKIMSCFSVVISKL
jgi:hypothetical protein